MKKYYIVIDDEKQGPFSIEELYKKDIFASTLIWTEEMENWTEAKSFEELKDVLIKTPPPIPKYVSIEKDESQIKTVSKVLVAKELKINYKLIRYALIISVIALPIFFAKNKGFENLYEYVHWKNQLTEEKNNRVNRDFHPHRHSFNLENYENNFKENKKRVKKSFLSIFYPSLITIPIAWILIITGRYIIKGVRWVNDTSKKE